MIKESSYHFKANSLFFKNTMYLPGMVVLAFNPSTREAEAGGFLSSRPAWSTK
jgi:major histocompatibility complex class I